MADYIPFYTRIWSDKKFTKLKDNDNRMLFIYLFSNPQINLTGIYELDIEVCKMKVRPLRDFDVVFQEIIDAGLIKWDAVTETVFVINRFKCIPNHSPKVYQGVVKELNILKHKTFREEFIKLYGNILKEESKKLLDEYRPQGMDEVLNEQQVNYLKKVGFTKEGARQFYINKKYPEAHISTILDAVFK